MKKFKIWYRDSSQILQVRVVKAVCEEMARLIFSNTHSHYEIKMIEEI